MPIYLPRSVAERMMRDKYTADAADNPVCPRCERVAMRDIGWTENRTGHCPHCGYHGKMEVTVKEYIDKGMYK